MENCSNALPFTEHFYADISSDVYSIVFLTLVCILAVVCILIFLEEVWYLRRVYSKDEVKLQRRVIMLGLYPVTVTTSLIILLVPRSTVLLDLVASCYLTICFYTFLSLIIDYFGGKYKMMELFEGTKIQLNTPPCCCCCCCVLKPVKMRRTPLRRLRYCSLQVAIIQPLLVFLAAVLWTDGKYDGGMTSASSNTYISILETISTLTSVYATMVIYRASRDHLKMYLLWMKFASFYTMFIVSNIQHLVFGILSNFNLPACVGTRGTKVRANALKHTLVVIEAFLLALLARKAYRRDETQIEGPVSAAEAGFSPFSVVTEQPMSTGDNSDTSCVANTSYSRYGADSGEILRSDNDNKGLGKNTNQTEVQHNSE
ncbi:organic solute transporter subunit alpha-like [Mercenaria mercenaria]|uniref:organic solute transporter subunit alpha-like n=1 Tax=Mercenaria mercenaria TaxID=6596 RepID=UPI00234F83B4|nr:organic solute transporter subunit alpha-like [Mercenaria mercenaria]XP_045159602.2 organic solute transporter subunit alpha-like [Mercenaria mercenaria]